MSISSFRRGRLAARLALGYLVLCVALWVWAAIASASVDGPSLAYAPLMLLTFPLSGPMTWLLDAIDPGLIGGWVGQVGLALCIVALSWLIWRVTRGPRVAA